MRLLSCIPSMQSKRANELYVTIVDDKAALSKAVASLLKSAGLRARSFSSAAEFLRFGHHDVTGCLILDVRLPSMTGLELQKCLLANGLDIPIVFITASADENGQLREQALSAGALTFLRKPFHHEDLLSAVQHALEKKTARGGG